MTFLNLAKSIVSFSLLGSVLSTAIAQEHSFAPPNDLWKEDSLNFAPNISKEKFIAIIEAAKEVYAPIAKANGDRLTVNARWDDATVNANCSRMFGSVTINMYGGLARRDEITPDGFALVLCHELGHAYGGKPYIQAWRRMSAEGQADYYGVGDCLNIVLPKLRADWTMIETTAYISEKCDALHPNNRTANLICQRKMTAGQSTANLLAVLTKEDTPDFETPDPTVVSSTLTSYPDTVQCRLDTYHNGALNLLRPACWFKN